jgi:hypothetical protein
MPTRQNRSLCLVLVCSLNWDGAQTLSSSPTIVSHIKLHVMPRRHPTLGEMIREQSMEEWAECVDAGKDQPESTAAECTIRPTFAMADADMQRQWIALEQQRLAFERLKYKQELELTNK